MGPMTERWISLIPGPALSPLTVPGVPFPLVILVQGTSHPNAVRFQQIICRLWTGQSEAYYAICGDWLSLIGHPKRNGRLGDSS